jgi:hypothetical protein
MATHIGSFLPDFFATSWSLPIVASAVLSLGGTNNVYTKHLKNDNQKNAK